LPYVAPEDWKPRGIEDLEPNAWTALRSSGNLAVVAGPGAGKTEFLAQRAAFLLETGICPAPYRILAISFKVDAAANLGARVRERCAPIDARRFSSMTFDSFTKGLVDRFHTVIPPHWRPSRSYEISFPRRPEVEDFLDRTRRSARPEWGDDIAGLSPNTFEPRYVGSYRLPLERAEVTSAAVFAVIQWWQDRYQDPAVTRLTFVMINRLAELLLRANQHILRALRCTYPFVFVDEFQDTTFAQYNFLASTFLHPGTSVTAVGDDKQKIMAWAGARRDAFARFEADFSATHIPLLFNFRSSPDLVRIQHVVAQALDPSSANVVSQVPRQIAGDVAQVWRTETVAREAEALAAWLEADMRERAKLPRDYALLVRQTADRFEESLAGPMARHGLRIRNESRATGRTTLQDLLTDDLVAIALALLRLGVERRSPDAWRVASAAVEQLRGADPDDEIACAQAETELSAFLSVLRDELGAAPPAPERAEHLASLLFAFIDMEAVARTYVQYEAGDLRDIMAEAFRLHLSTCAAEGGSWVECLDAFEGHSHVPLMTVHKSKGLEYDTIIFVGLDDAMWWSYDPRNPEGMATFFVALSRAKQRAIFTFCEERGDRRRIADLYRLLTTAGVPEVAA
jgi:superfamily I DNA/RNA helicase